jgi:Lon protease-like protein
VHDALGQGRLCGLIQPSGGEETVGEAPPPLYSVGTVGRIVHFSETDARQLFVVLLGICRFRVEAEVEPGDGYRRLAGVYAPFREAVAAPGGGTVAAPRARIASALKRTSRRMPWNSTCAPSMPCRFLPVATCRWPCPSKRGKTGVLEALTLEHRFNALCALMEMGAIGGGGDAQQ